MISKFKRKNMKRIDEKVNHYGMISETEKKNFWNNWIIDLYKANAHFELKHRGENKTIFYLNKKYI